MSLRSLFAESPNLVTGAVGSTLNVVVLGLGAAGVHVPVEVVAAGNAAFAAWVAVLHQLVYSAPSVERLKGRVRQQALDDVQSLAPAKARRK